MFTGIVEAVGVVEAVVADAGGRRLTVAAPGVVPEVQPGQSISVDGVCLTVESTDSDTFDAFLSTETLERSTLGNRAEDDRVNLERALAADGRFDGHIVQGHVDTTVAITGIDPVGEEWWCTFELPAGLERYVVEKGSIALDGISLTVAERTDDGFAVAIIPTTYQDTSLSDRSVGDAVNVEVDIVAKYVDALVEPDER